jgi:hypothetical protein
MSEQPITRERVFVQVKTTLGQASVKRLDAAFRQAYPQEQFYLVSPTFKGTRPRPVHARTTILSEDDLARAILRAGLQTWVLQRAGASL